jgi:hypothetical protein
MDSSEIRRANLRALLAREKAGGGTTETFASKVGTSAAYVSQMLGPKPSRAPGSNFCRKVEAAMRLDHGLLDRDQSSAPFDMLSAEARELLGLWATLLQPTQAHLKALLRALANPASPRYLAFEQALEARTGAPRASKPARTKIR